MNKEEMLTRANELYELKFLVGLNEDEETELFLLEEKLFYYGI